MENNVLNLETTFQIFLMELANNHEDYTVQQLITALKATTTLTTLWVYGGPASYEPTPLLYRRVVEPICRCIANLRLQNEHHPLKAVEFSDVESGIVRQFLVALKQFGIRRVQIRSIEPLPTHILVDFCHDNSNLKVLELHSITFNDEVVADPIDGSATNLNLDKLILVDVRFKTSFAATNFAPFLARMSASALRLGALQDEYCEFKMPSVEELTLYPSCEIKSFQAALDAGMATVTQLSVFLMPRDDKNETPKKLESLTRMIRGAVKLNSLTIHSRGHKLPQLLQALEACATVTEIHVNDNDGDGIPYALPVPDVQPLRRITARNSELGQFVANPSTFPNDTLLTLMRQFNNCPTGLYMLTRRLPEVFSFEKGNSLMVEPNPAHESCAREENL
jgi:hypothetical protein